MIRRKPQSCTEPNPNTFGKELMLLKSDPLSQATQALSITAFEVVSRGRQSNPHKRSDNGQAEKRGSKTGRSQTGWTLNATQVGVANTRQQVESGWKCLAALCACFPVSRSSFPQRLLRTCVSLLNFESIFRIVLSDCIYVVIETLFARQARGKAHFVPQPGESLSLVVCTR